MRLKVFYLIFVLVIIESSCDNTSDKTIRISDDSNIHEVVRFDENGDTLVSLSLFENGYIKSIDLKVDGNPDAVRKLSFHSNGRIKSYGTIENRIYTENHVMADSTGMNWDLYLINKDERGVYLNQKIILNEYGTISSRKSYFLINDAYAVFENDEYTINLEIRIVGQKYDKSLAVIGEFDSNYDLNSTKVDTFHGTGNTVHCEIDAVQGLNIIRGYALDYKDDMKDTALYGRKIYFTEKLVIPKR